MTIYHSADADWYRVFCLFIRKFFDFDFDFDPILEFVKKMLFTETAKDNRIFLRCFRSGKYVSCGFLTVYFIPNRLPFNRFGISVGKKQGGAVERNRIKRIFRAAYRLNETRFPIGCDIIFAARNDACERTSSETADFLVRKAVPKMIKELAADADRNDNRCRQAHNNKKMK